VREASLGDPPGGLGGLRHCGSPCFWSDQWHDSRLGCERSRVQCPEQPWHFDRVSRGHGGCWHRSGAIRKEIECDLQLCGVKERIRHCLLFLFQQVRKSVRFGALCPTSGAGWRHLHRRGGQGLVPGRRRCGPRVRCCGKWAQSVRGSPLRLLRLREDKDLDLQKELHSSSVCIVCDTSLSNGAPASAGNRTRVTSMATMYSATRPLMLLTAPQAWNLDMPRPADLCWFRWAVASAPHAKRKCVWLRSAVCW